MAKLELNPLMAALHGAIGDLVLVREGDEIYVRHKARKTPPRTEGQVSHNNRFATASRWARTLLADPAMHATYARGCSGHLTAHNVAIRDFMHAPVIPSIGLDGYSGQPGDLIRIAATDDFRVVRVSLQIRTAAGEMLEEGPADWCGIEGVWRYTGQRQIPAQTTLQIEVTALDLPGNSANAKAWHYVG